MNASVMSIPWIFMDLYAYLVEDAHISHSEANNYVTRLMCLADLTVPCFGEGVRA